MPIPKSYLHDKLVLLLVSSNVFLAFLCSVLVFLRISTGEGEGFIIEYRANLGIGAFSTGTVLDMLSFAVFSVLVAAATITLSIGVYRIRRMLSLLVLGFGVLLLLMAIIVSNALLVLR